MVKVEGRTEECGVHRQSWTEWLWCLDWGDDDGVRVKLREG